MSSILSRTIDTSLAGKVLVRIAIRVALVIIVMTAIAYYHVFSTVKEQSLGQLEKYIIERTQRERAIFELAENNHTQLKKELIKRLRFYEDSDPVEEFNRKVERFPDGTMRTRPEGFDGTRDAFVFIGKDVEVTAEKRRRIKTFIDLAEEYGTAWHHQLQNVYFTTPGNMFTGFWPEVSDWAHSLPADMYLPDEEYVWVADKKHNPSRESVWTGLFYDIASRIWMVSVETPVDIDGQHIATIGHDITLNELLERTVGDHLEGAYNLIVRGDGRLIAHPDKMGLIKDKKGYFDVSTSDDEHLRSIYQAIKIQPNQDVIEHNAFDEYLAIGRLKEPGWYFVTVYPRSLISAPAFETAGVVLLLGAISLFLELLIFYGVLKKNISTPLTQLTRAVNYVAEGKLDTHLRNGRSDELGVLGKAFNHMTKAIEIKENQIRSTSQVLDSIIENVPNMIFLKDAHDLRFKYFNRAGEKLLGLDRSELLGRNDYDFFPEEQADYFTSKDREVLELHDLMDIPGEKIETPKGTRILHTKKIALRDKEGIPQYLLGISEDITEQKQTLQKLRSQANIIDQIHDSVVSTDLDGYVTSWNKGAERIFGYASEEMLGKHIATVYPEEEHETLRDDVIAPLKKKGSHDIEVCMQRKSGEVFYGELSLAMIIDDESHETGMIGYTRDVTDRKLAEEALIASEERLRMINAHVSGIVFQFKVDTNGVRFLPYVSPTVEKYIGLTAETVMADVEEWLALTHPDDLPELEASIVESMESMSRWEWEGRFIHKNDGDVRWLSGSSTPINSFDGSILWNGVFIDVTDRRKAEEALKESEAHLRKAQELSQVGHWKLNPTTGEVWGSDELFHIFDLSREEATLESFVEVVHPDDREMDLAAIKRGAEQGESWDIEHRLICRDGMEKWVHAIGEAVTDENGNVLELIGTVQDVTEHAQVDAILRAMAAGGSGLQLESFLNDVLARLAELYDCKYAFIGQLNPDGEHVQTLAVRANGEVAENFEYSLQGTPCQDILDRAKELIPKYASKIYSKDQQLIDMGVESYFGAPLTASDGSIIGILSVMDVKEMNLDEWTEPVLGVFARRVSLELERDYATKELQQHREHLEELVQQRTADMKAARDEAERANAAKSEFLSRMSHELRTPMNAILGFSQLLELDKNDLNQDQNENVKEIIDAGHHLLVLIDEVLDLAKIESGKLEITLDDISVDDLLKQSLTLIDSQARANRIKVRDCVSGDGLMVRADPIRLKQVLLNLLSNAVKYNCENGQIIIERKNINDQRLRICVTDTGSGLSDDAIEKLFTPFERLGADNTIQGTGIGLVITKHLVEKMGGTIGIESTPGKGSTFWLELAMSHVAHEPI